LLSSAAKSLDEKAPHKNKTAQRIAARGLFQPFNRGCKGLIVMHITLYPWQKSKRSRGKGFILSPFMLNTPLAGVNVSRAC
jgi:hypothetical protein